MIKFKQLQFKTLKLKQAIREFVSYNNYRPSKWSTNIIERKLGKALSHYSEKNSASYDLEFIQEIYKFPAWQQFKKLHKEK